MATNCKGNISISIEDFRIFQSRFEECSIEFNKNSRFCLNAIIGNNNMDENDLTADYPNIVRHWHVDNNNENRRNHAKKGQDGDDPLVDIETEIQGIPILKVYEDCSIIVKEMEATKALYKNADEFVRTAIGKRKFTIAGNVEECGIAGLGLVVDADDDNAEPKETDKAKIFHKDGTEYDYDTKLKANVNERKCLIVKVKKFERAKN